MIIGKADCFSATSWEQPSIVEMWANTAACGTQYNVLGREREEAERTFQSSFREVRS